MISEPSSPSHDQNSSYLELLAENANLQKKITLLESNSQTSEATSNNPWKQELEKSQIMIQDLTNALEDRLVEVDIIKVSNTKEYIFGFRQFFVTIGIKTK